jgi:hypothetical protein
MIPTLLHFSALVPSLLPCLQAEDEVKTYSDAKGRPRASVRETLIGFSDPAMNLESFLASPDGRRLAYVVMAGDGLAVVLDGVQGELFEGIGDQSLAFSPGGTHFGYVGTRPGLQCIWLDGKVHEYQAVSKHGVVFSPVGERAGWVGVRDGKYVVVVDGVESPPYSGVAPQGLTFSPDGKRYAYAASNGGVQLVVTDGQEGPLFDTVAELQFTANSDHVVYLGMREGKRYVILDGEPIGPFDELRNLSSTPQGQMPTMEVLEIAKNGSRVGFIAARGAEWFVVVDGKETGPFQKCGGLSISPDGSRVAFLANRGEGWLMIVDGEERPAAGLRSLSFSPDGKREAWIVTREERAYAAIEGVESKPFDSIEEPGVLFSQDGKHTAFVASIGGEHVVVVDGQEGPPFKRLGRTPLAFAPAGPTTLHSIRRGERETLVIGGKEGPPMKSFRSLVFSPDGSRHAYAAELDKDRWVVVVDGESFGPGGKLGPGDERAYESLGKRTPLFSPDGSRVAWVGVRETGWVAVVDGVESRPFDIVMRSTLDFSPDGAHVVYVAARGNDRMIVIDDFECVGGWTGFLAKSDFVWSGPNRFSIRGSRVPKFLLLEVEVL